MLGRFGFPHYQLKGRLYSQQAQIRHQRRLLFELLFQFHYQQHNSMFHDLPFSGYVSGFIWKKNHISFVIDMALNRYILQMCESPYFTYREDVSTINDSSSWKNLVVFSTPRYYWLRWSACMAHQFCLKVLLQADCYWDEKISLINLVIIYLITLYHDHWIIQHLPV